MCGQSPPDDTTPPFGIDQACQGNQTEASNSAIHATPSLRAAPGSADQARQITNRPGEHWELGLGVVVDRDAQLHLQTAIPPSTPRLVARCPVDFIRTKSNPSPNGQWDHQPSEDEQSRALIPRDRIGESKLAIASTTSTREAADGLGATARRCGALVLAFKQTLRPDALGRG
ncbi:hypothetical protein B0T16DRAFT_390162 [Cercophora newfieldiana]|uniref:Uncharacterized protein n=1 Tax=Cercophora newfieldiana TaxID=92897 RepID=A0AA39Y6U0_9PEZI|nr:hypothetical protein B0T16DRAFT_390162 [Cercophora newfieldiana]